MDSPADISPPSAKVLWITRNYYPELGGASERFRRYLPGLTSRNVSVGVVCTTRNPDLPHGAQHEMGIHVYREYLASPTPLLADLTLIQRAIQLTQKNGREHSCHAVQFYGLRPEILPYLRQLKRQKVKIIQVGTIVTPDAPESKASVAKRLVKRVKNRYLESFCEKIIVSSQVMGRDRIKLGAVPSQIQVISNGVDLSRFSPPSEEQKQHLRAQFGIPKGTLAILYLGVLTPRKRIDWIIQAFHQVKAQVPHARLYLVGPVERPTMHNLAEAAQQNSYHAQLIQLAGAELDRSIFFTGETHVPQNWFKAADLFTFASEHEGLGNVLLEAMACGVPVLTTEFVGRADELGRPGKDYLLADETPTALAAGLAQACLDENLRTSLAASALAHVREHHDLEKTLNQYAELYRSMARFKSGRDSR